MLPLLLPLGMAGLGYLQAEKKRKQELEMAKANAEANRYSPWTHVNNQIVAPTSDGLSGAMQGGLSGAMMMQSMGGMGGAKPSVGSEMAAAPTQMATMGENNGRMMDAGRYDQMQGIESSELPKKRYSYWG